ncbi:hypothetical protein EKL97_14440 [Flavobacterium sp. LS1P28]|uniref:beta strand repeat-containing protein n=1 Tax=Flavobacterium sp. LS1P28 TaxID=2497752 RepID=UPI000F8440AA|nr:hypothetical protein [Flavobacterium sp. LS1P28]RTY78239.1 hypothetical protein EKL97_14440 [Flavobacterium sp. LS1P28]
MKKIILLIFLFIGAKNFAQTNGITYQAVILNPKGEKIPGVNNSNAFLVSKDICMKFEFVDEYSNVEYQEVIQTKTDKFGMVNLIIGSGSQTGGYASSFQEIVWNSISKKLIVAINTNGSCNSFTEISNQHFNSVPFAFFTKNAENVTGMVAIENGGTGAITMSGLKTNFGMENMDNTSDLNKPISAAAQLVFSLKENVTNKSTSIATDAASDTKYPTVKSVKTYVDSQVPTTGPQGIQGDTGAAGVAGATGAAGLTTSVNGVTQVNGAITLNKTDIGLGNVNNTADADKPVSSAIQTALDAKASLVALAVKADQSAVDLKAPLASPTFTGTVSGVTATMVGLGNVNNTSDAAKPISTAIQTALDLKASLAALAAKSDQSAVDLKAPLASPTFTGTVAGITSTMVGLGNVDNTSDVNKPVSTLTATALGSKVDKVTGERLINATEITKLGNQSGTNSGDQDLSGLTTIAATNTALALKANIASPTFTGAPILPTGTIGVTQAVGNNTTALATTAFVNAATSAGGSFVDLTTAQTVAGVKTFSTDAKFNEITVGRGTGNSFYSTAVGYEALKVNTTGSVNTANGALALRNNTTGSENTAIGVNALHINAIGSNNTGIGSNALYYTSGRGNTAIGKDAMYENTTGNNNTAIGYNTGVSAGSGTGSGNTILGANVTGLATTLTNNIILANGTGAIKAQNNGTNWTLTGGLTAGGITYPAINGTNGQVLTTNGSGVATWAAASGGFTHYLGELFNGGIIYYLYKGSDGLEHGLIVALTESTYAWQTAPTLTGANRTEDGAFNTNLMTGSPTKTYINGLGPEWYLPSIDELILLYSNRYSAQKALRAGNNTLLSISANYWSSTENTNSMTYNFSFLLGYVIIDLKTTAVSVRGVRAF